MDCSLITKSKNKSKVRRAVDMKVNPSINHLCLVHHPFIVRQNRDLAIEMLGGLSSIREVIFI